MARNALRACFTFNLLDLGHLPRSGLVSYLEHVPLFRDVGNRLLGLDAEALADWLLAELLRAQAVMLVGDDIVPTMAA